MDANRKLVELLAGSVTFEKFARAFNEVMGMPLTLCQLETWQLPFAGKPHESPFCAIMAEHSQTCAACLRSQNRLTRSATHKPAIRKCHYGFSEIAVPIKFGPETIGFLQTGQTLRQKPTTESFHKVVAQAARLGVNINNEKTKRAYFSARVVTQKKLTAASVLLAIFAEHLSMMGNQLSVQALNAEPPAITRTKQFIRDHCTETLSLGRVSSAMNTSLFHFCKQFRKNTGLSFIEFLSRTRIEKAKGLLFNPNLRVSEIAYDSGFQSLATFNRVFKKIAGQTPTEYRGKTCESA